MRTIHLLSFILFFTSSLSSQVAPNFTVTDLNGQSHTLYDYLDEGKTVILDFYAVWCGPCQVNAPGVEAIWLERGPDGTNEVMILGLEADDSSTDAETAQYAIDYDCSNPQINDTGDLNNIYGIDYYPTYFVVCPDRTMYQYEGDNANEIELALNGGIDDCAPYLDIDLDARIFSYNSSATVCSESTTPNIRIMNMGQQDLTSLIIKVYLDGTLESTSDWSGSLSLYEAENVALPTVLLTSSSDPEISVTIENPNGMEDPNPANDSVVVPIDYGGSTFETTTVHFELVFDNFPQETTWEFKDSQGEVVVSGGNYIGFPDFSPPLDTVMTFPSGDCYTFNIYDAAGDGMCCSFGVGFWKISTDNEVIMGEGGTFTSQESLLFGVAEAVGLAENVLDNLVTIYPNPNEGEFTLDLSSYPEDTHIRILDMSGKEIKVFQAKAYTTSFIEIDVTRGSYLLEINSDLYHFVKRLMVD